MESTKPLIVGSRQRGLVFGRAGPVGTATSAWIVAELQAVGQGRRGSVRAGNRQQAAGYDVPLQRVCSG